MQSATFSLRMLPNGATWNNKSISRLCPTLNTNFDDVDKLLVGITPSLWDILPTNEVKGVTFNLFWNKMSHTCVKFNCTFKQSTREFSIALWLIENQSYNIQYKEIEIFISMSFKAWRYGQDAVKENWQVDGKCKIKCTV